jgi:hypothetical protein
MAASSKRCANSHPHLHCNHYGGRHHALPQRSPAINKGLHTLSVGILMRFDVPCSATTCKHHVQHCCNPISLPNPVQLSTWPCMTLPTRNVARSSPHNSCYVLLIGTAVLWLLVLPAAQAPAAPAHVKTVLLPSSSCMACIPSHVQPHIAMQPNHARVCAGSGCFPAGTPRSAKPRPQPMGNQPANTFPC